MKNIMILVTAFIAQSGILQAEEAVPPKSLSSTMEVYVFPAKGQTAEQQSMDEVECYNWATTNTGTDPFALSKESEAQAQANAQAEANAQNAGRGAGARGALRGAAAGAVIGEIANDDSSDGAKVGATVGLVRGRRSARNAQSNAVNEAEQIQATQQQASAEKLANFKSAFGVCLEAKEYMVKY